ncbi:MAG TPA: FkbM family methyltransferase [Parvibaculum sp.]
MRFKSKPFRKRLDILRGKAPGWFLKDLKGVIHVGANTGAEHSSYAAHDLNVLWIEPIPSVFEELERNISDHPKQSAIRALVSQRSGDDVTLHVSNNGGQSSSILPIGLHKDIWPDVHFVADIKLKSETLADVLARSGRSKDEFDCLVMDTQGSEMLVLTGALDMLPQFRFIHTEVADFEIYEGCCTLADMDAFMAAHGFREAHRWRFAKRKEGGKCYDITYRRV